VRRTVRLLRPAAAVLHLLAVSVVVLAGFLWKRYWAIRTFERSLRRAGLPRDVASEFTRDYRRMTNLPIGLCGLKRRKG
jgi:hypothetical protein